jgi:sugar phosphate isomerase/epimerase
MPTMQSDGIQLYTLRDLTAKDFAGTMKQVAALGYKFVETAGYGNLGNATAARKALDNAGLKASSGHYAIDMLENKVEQVIADAQTLGFDTVVCPFLPEDRRKDAAGYEATAKVLERAGSMLHGHGLILAYHNHSFEFQKFGGKYGLDILYDNTAPHLMVAEIDVYWVKHGGVNPAEYIDKLGDRVRLLHLKDMGRGPEQRFAPVGTGVIDFKPILAVAEKHGVRWGIVEQDSTYGAPPLDQIKTSLANLKKLGAL